GAATGEQRRLRDGWLLSSRQEHVLHVEQVVQSKLGVVEVGLDVGAQRFCPEGEAERVGLHLVRVDVQREDVEVTPRTWRPGVDAAVVPGAGQVDQRGEISTRR